MIVASHFRPCSEEVSQAIVVSVPGAPLLLLDLNSSSSPQEWTTPPHPLVSQLLYRSKKTGCCVTQKIPHTFSYTNRNWSCFCSFPYRGRWEISYMIDSGPEPWTLDPTMSSGLPKTVMSKKWGTKNRKATLADQYSKGDTEGPLCFCKD